MENTFTGKSEEDISRLLGSLVPEASPTVYRKIFSLLDFTSLNVTDNNKTIESICEKINNFTYSFPDLPSVAAFCVYPRFIPLLKKSLIAPGVRIASVAASFPASQTFIDIKKAECKRAIDAGADEIDIVMSVGDFMGNNRKFVKEEISTIKEVVGDKHLKVIIESGILPDPASVYEASMLAMEAGADFIKTSTGKEKYSASLESVYVMCHAIRDFHKSSKKMIGIKPAGGISSAEDAEKYYSLVEMILGHQWLVPQYFRLGASRLANNILNAIEGREVNYF